MKRALIVEDNPVWADILVQYCLAAGLASTVVRSPQAAMDSLDQVLPEVIILDMLLATETGMALLNEMRSYDDLAAVPIVVCSSVPISNLESLEPYGVVAIMNKADLTPSRVVEVLRGAIRE